MLSAEIGQRWLRCPRIDGGVAVSRVQAIELVALVEEYQRAFNEHDLGAWADLVDPEIEIEVASFSLSGIDAAKAFAEQIDPTFAGNRESTGSSRLEAARRAWVTTRVDAGLVGKGSFFRGAAR
jgi:hypothetical protein